jgi:hypothetical protein
MCGYPTNTYMTTNPMMVASRYSPRDEYSPYFQDNPAVYVPPCEESQPEQYQASAGLYNTGHPPKLTLQSLTSDAPGPYRPSPFSVTQETSWGDTMILSTPVIEQNECSMPSGSSTTSSRQPAAHPGESDPPKDANGRIYCYICTGESPQFFIRPCEWRKHMDKHERPHVCKYPGCSKLPGFTYSGGLTRHEREVHGKGAGAGRLYCPHSTCKRSRSASQTKDRGFTRKENLAEHMRRVHTESVEEPLALDVTRKKRKRKSTPSEVSDVHSDTSDEGLRGEMKRMRRERDDLQKKNEMLTELLMGKMDEIRTFMAQKT